jgi:hypothetical protein
MQTTVFAILGIVILAVLLFCFVPSIPSILRARRAFLLVVEVVIVGGLCLWVVVAIAQALLS